MRLSTEIVQLALLVFISPRDSIQSAWTATCLVLALVVPAIVQQASGSLTLHHAVLVFK
jgi:hypothetical protein